MEKKRSPWICCTVPPVRDGLYEVRVKQNDYSPPGYVFRSYFFRPSDFYSYLINRHPVFFEWRGLAEKPKY